MGQLQERCVVDGSGKRVEVLAGAAEFEKILEKLESIRAYDTVKAANDESGPLDKTFQRSGKSGSELCTTCTAPSSRRDSQASR